MNIRQSDGHVTFANGQIGREIPKQDFLKSSLGSIADVLVDNDPYVTYRFRPEQGIAASASFISERLTDVTLLLEFPDEANREWTQEIELERKQIHDDWLLKEMGKPPYRYAWGEISSSFDSKGCVSDIILRYAR